MNAIVNRSTRSIHEKHEHKFSKIKTTTTQKGDSDNETTSLLREKLCEMAESVKHVRMENVLRTNTKFTLSSNESFVHEAIKLWL